MEKNQDTKSCLFRVVSTREGNTQKYPLKNQMPTLFAMFVSYFLYMSFFRRLNAQYSCNNIGKSTNDFHWRGTALGGWLVIEPWITPSLFYQFLGASERWGDDAKNRVGLDPFSFCTALGKEEANRQLRRHWETWLKEEHIYNLSISGVDTLRIPVADWMYIPYEPYIGCWDGALDELQRALGYCRKYGIKVLIDLHAVKDSQNGLDNSGITADLEWIGTYSKDGYAKYRHWDIRAANWAGKFNTTTKKYDTINMANVAFTLSVIEKINDIHRNDPTIVAFEPCEYYHDTTSSHFYFTTSNDF